MKEREYGVETKKVVAVGVLFVISGAIFAFGAYLAVYSLAHQVSFLVMGSQIHGAVFGAVIAFLGARYFLAVRKLKEEVYRPTSRFSWDNFRKGR
ncbi:hypothetical protein [Papillibacter cinnamivorans]|uniref:Uncharacterized protein n=1 Tax=Papillibacter cinnamivorans DSM 12816 TaxID=1122930 RepID=A0A1W2C1D9_9FIRM|nr:hypothetical protein [Papillibacter cinnamivorans]SMC78891.1 hypothetical protein SAMN02745168_2504 [Papillibacter cinnamivorans DSM 12816]